MQWERISAQWFWWVFVGAFFVSALWESLRPMRESEEGMLRRWTRHLGTYAITVVVLMLVLRTSPLLVSLWAWEKKVGLFPLLGAPWWMSVPLSWLAVDFYLYGIHRLYHEVRPLWRVHEVHHSDREYDVSTGLRFHPLESVMTQVGYLGVVVLLGVPPMAVVMAELLVNAVNFLVHANAQLPRGVERLVHQVFITPDLHRVHHSEEFDEQHRNYGQTLSIWDRMLGTFQAEPVAGFAGMQTGVLEWRGQKGMGIGFLLSEPFRELPKLPGSGEEYVGGDEDIGEQVSKERVAE